MIGRGAHSLAALAIASSTGRSPSDQEVDALVKAQAGAGDAGGGDGRDGGATRGDALRG